MHTFPKKCKICLLNFQKMCKLFKVQLEKNCGFRRANTKTQVDLVLTSTEKREEKRMSDIGKDLQDAFMDGYNYRDVEIVRCKDCKFSSPNGQVGCTIHPFSPLNANQVLFEDDYCSRGERRSE